MHLKNIRKKRFVISILILICGVFALYPYLSRQPRDPILKTISHLDKSLSASIVKTLILGDALVDKGHDLSLTGEQGEALVNALDKLNESLNSLKQALRAMPARSKQLSPDAEAAYKKLDDQLTDFIISISESELTDDAQ